MNEFIQCCFYLLYCEQPCAVKTRSDEENCNLWFMLVKSNDMVKFADSLVVLTDIVIINNFNDKIVFSG